MVHPPLYAEAGGLWPLLLAVGIGLLRAAPLVCNTDEDCSHNGACVQGVCDCLRGWTGASCSTLGAGFVDKAKFGYNQLAGGVSTLGGSVVRDDHGIYHLWASEVTRKCGARARGTNSQCVHAVSMDPEGPYAKTATVFGPMCYMPSVIRAPTGEYVMFFTGIYDGITEVGINGVGGFGSDHAYTVGLKEVECSCDLGARTSNESVAPLWTDCVTTTSSDPTWMSWTWTPAEDDSWSKPVMIIDPRDADSAMGFSGSIVAGDTLHVQLAPVEIAIDGSLKAFWRSWQACSGETLDGERCSVLHPLTASHWHCGDAAECRNRYLFSNSRILAPMSPFEPMSESGAVLPNAEEPFGWRDSNGVYHALFHRVNDCNGTLYSSIFHAYSKDFSGQWNSTGTAFSGDLFFTDGSTVTLRRCSLPSLVRAGGVALGSPTAAGGTVLILACLATDAGPGQRFMQALYPSLSAAGVMSASFTLALPLSGGSGTAPSVPGSCGLISPALLDKRPTLAAMGCPALCQPPDFSFFVHPPLFEKEGVLSVHYHRLHDVLLRHPSRTLNESEAAYSFLGIDVACEVNWPLLGGSASESVATNYIMGSPTTCLQSRTRRLQNYLAKIGASANRASQIVVFDMLDSVSETPQEFRRVPTVVVANPGFDVDTYRHNVDVSFPHTPVLRVTESWRSSLGTACDSTRWHHLVTFRGRDSSELRRKLASLHDGREVIIELTPREEPVSTSTDPSVGPAAYRLRMLAETRFVLAPQGGVGPGSSRLSEVVCAGAVPVIVADNWVLPFAETGGADYAAFSVQVPEDRWADIPSMLRKYSDEDVCRMQRAALIACEEHFGTMEAQINTLVRILARRVHRAPGGVPLGNEPHMF